MRRTAATVLALGTVLCTATSAFATANVDAERLSGDNRYETAQDISVNTFGPGTTVAIVASGENFPDALAAAYLAGGLGAPILLTDPRTLSDETRTELARLQVEGVIIVGGTQAVQTPVETALEAEGYEVDRLFGEDRYETGQVIAESLPQENIGAVNGTVGRTAIVTTGEKFPDALAVGPLAYDFGFPIVLTRPEALSGTASSSLETLDIQHVLLLGGPEAVTPAVETQIEAMGIEVDRVFGNNRMETAAAIADLAIARLGFVNTHVNLARGDFFADALAGGPHAGEEKAVILLTLDPNSLSTATRDWLADRSSTVSSLDVYGGPAAVSDAVITDARRAAGDNSA